MKQLDRVRIQRWFSLWLLKSQLNGTVAGINCKLSICACTHPQSSSMIMKGYIFFIFGKFVFFSVRGPTLRLRLMWGY